MFKEWVSANPLETLQKTIGSITYTALIKSEEGRKRKEELDEDLHFRHIREKAELRTMLAKKQQRVIDEIDRKLILEDEAERYKEWLCNLKRLCYDLPTTNWNAMNKSDKWE